MVDGQQKFHHYVPRWYLCRFANEADFLWAGDKRSDPRGQVREAHVSSVAGAKYFNAVDLDDVRSNAVESWLSTHIEGPAAAPFELLANEGPQALSASARLAVSRHLAFQMVRVPATREVFDRAADEIALRAGFARAETFEERRTEHVQTMVTAGDQILKAFLLREWQVLDLGVDVLPTSDRPVHLWSATDSDNPFWRSPGAMTADQIVVPMDPRRVLVMHQHPVASGPRYSPLGSGTDAELATKLVLAMGQWSTRFVFGQPGALFFHAPYPKWILPTA